MVHVGVVRASAARLTTLQLENKKKECLQQYLRQVRTHPIAHQAQIPRLPAQYVLESGAHI
jgi:hypothetical protein